MFDEIHSRFFFGSEISKMKLLVFTVVYSTCVLLIGMDKMDFHKHLLNTTDIKRCFKTHCTIRGNLLYLCSWSLLTVLVELLFRFCFYIRVMLVTAFLLLCVSKYILCLGLVHEFCYLLLTSSLWFPWLPYINLMMICHG